MLERNEWEKSKKYFKQSAEEGARNEMESMAKIIRKKIKLRIKFSACAFQFISLFHGKGRCCQG
jgi:hypothetical protein